MQLLQLPVRLHGIPLGHPVDLLLHRAEWRVLGFVVLCGDESERFLVFAAADLGSDEIAVPSALPLLEDVDFYRDRSRSFRALLGHSAASEGAEAGELRDLLLAPDGRVAAIVVERDEVLDDVEPGGTRIECVSAA
jgi:hypothetical protein